MTFSLPDILRNPNQQRQGDALNELDCECCCCIPSPKNTQSKDARSLTVRKGQSDVLSGSNENSTSVLSAFNQRTEDLLEQAERALNTGNAQDVGRPLDGGAPRLDSNLETQARRFLVRSGRSGNIIDTSPLERLTRDVAGLRQASMRSQISSATGTTGTTRDGNGSISGNGVIDTIPLERLARDVAELRQGSNGSGVQATSASGSISATFGGDVDISGSGVIDTSALNKAAEDARALYAAVQEAAIEYEKQTAGAKLAKDKAKAVTG